MINVLNVLGTSRQRRLRSSFPRLLPSNHNLHPTPLQPDRLPPLLALPLRWLRNLDLGRYHRHGLGLRAQDGPGKLSRGNGNDRNGRSRRRGRLCRVARARRRRGIWSRRRRRRRSVFFFLCSLSSLRCSCFLLHPLVRPGGARASGAPSALRRRRHRPRDQRRRLGALVRGERGRRRALRRGHAPEV